jgi:hypothetical protein
MNFFGVFEKYKVHKIKKILHQYNLVKLIL